VQAARLFPLLSPSLASGRETDEEEHATEPIGLQLTMLEWKASTAAVFFNGQSLHAYDLRGELRLIAASTGACTFFLFLFLLFFLPAQD
jgi:hypothetical protein